MKISLPNVAIIKMEGHYQFTGIMHGVYSSLGVFSSVKEGALKVLDSNNLKPVFREQLEKVKRKGREVNWDEEALFNASWEEVLQSR